MGIETAIIWGVLLAPSLLASSAGLVIALKVAERARQISLRKFLRACGYGVFCACIYIAFAGISITLEPVSGCTSGGCTNGIILILGALLTAAAVGALVLLALLLASAAVAISKKLAPAE